MEMNLIYAFLPLAAFIISALTTKFLLRYLKKRGVLDIPNERSSHKTPTPRGGGIGILAGVAICGGIYCISYQDYKLLLIILVSLVIGGVGLVDDVRKGLHTGLRFTIQLVCSLIIILVFSPVEILPLPHPFTVNLYFAGYIISVIWLIGITNIFNFLDGIDGYAGTQGLIGGLMLALLAWNTPVGIIGLIIALANVGFLLYNWHPARIFMGDVGSSFSGFLFAALPFYFQHEGIHGDRSQLFFGTAVFLWFFLLDGTFTMFRRLFKKEKIWQAHRSHLYQRLVISGMSHNNVVLSICFFYMILLAVMLFYAAQPHSSIIQWPVLITGLALFLVYAAYTFFREKKAREQHS